MFFVYLLGVVVSVIVFLYVTARSEGEITLADIMLCCFLAMLSWLSVFVYFVVVALKALDNVVVWQRREEDEVRKSYKRSSQ